MIDDQMMLEFRRAAKSGVAHDFLRLHVTNDNAHDFALEIARVRSEGGGSDWKFDPVDPLLNAVTSPIIQYVVVEKFERANRKCRVGLTFLLRAQILLPEAGFLILANARQHYERYLATPRCGPECDECFEEGQRVLSDDDTLELFVSNIAGAVALAAPHAVNIRKMCREPLTHAMLIHMIADAAAVRHPGQRLVVSRNFPQDLRERLFTRAEEVVLAAKKDKNLLTEFPCCQEIIESILDEIEG